MFKGHQPALTPSLSGLEHWHLWVGDAPNTPLMLFGVWLGLLPVDQEKTHSPEQQQKEQERQELKHGVQMQQGHPGSPPPATAPSKTQQEGSPCCCCCLQPLLVSFLGSLKQPLQLGGFFPLLPSHQGFLLGHFLAGWAGLRGRRAQERSSTTACWQIEGRAHCSC